MAAKKRKRRKNGDGLCHRGHGARTQRTEGDGRRKTDGRRFGPENFLTHPIFRPQTSDP